MVRFQLLESLERDLEHIAGKVQLAAYPELNRHRFQELRFDDPPLVVAFFEPRIGKQKVKSIDGTRWKHAIEVDVQVDVGKLEVGEAEGRPTPTIPLDPFLPDLQAHDEALRVCGSELETKFRVRAAELDLHPSVRGEV